MNKCPMEKTQIVANEKFENPQFQIFKFSQALQIRCYLFLREATTRIFWRWLRRLEEGVQAENSSENNEQHGSAVRFAGAKDVLDA